MLPNSLSGKTVAIGGAVTLLLLACVYYVTDGSSMALIFTAAATLIIALAFWGLSFLQKSREKKAGAALKNALPGAQAARQARGAVKDMRDRWKEAVEQLDRGGIDLYAMPWYMLIGEPQSGKSTTLLNSDLQFPVGKESRSGAGGTRNCDWWFTNDAVILDTAGRFSFQEQNAPDATEWAEFLRLLARNRSRCPVNGVILAIPCTSLLEEDGEERQSKAHNLLDKLGQLEQELGIQFPVYLLITKCDLVSGFVDFSTRLTAQGQRQLFGWSNTEPLETPFDPSEFPTEMATMVESLKRWRLKWIDEPMTQGALDRLFSFPDEFEALTEPLLDYVSVLFAPNRYSDGPFLRGVYFTSGVQKGRPVMKACAELLGVTDPKQSQDLAEAFEKSRAFFIRDFYREKVFPEQGLVRPTRRASQKTKSAQQVLNWTAGSLAALILLGLVHWVLFSSTAFKNVKNVLSAAKEHPPNEPADSVLQDLLDQFKSVQEGSLAPGVGKLVGQSKVPRVLDELTRSIGDTLFKDLGNRFLANSTTGPIENLKQYEAHRQAIGCLASLLYPKAGSEEIDLPQSLLPLIPFVEESKSSEFQTLVNHYDQFLKLESDNIDALRQEAPRRHLETLATSLLREAPQKLGDYWQQALNNAEPNSERPSLARWLRLTGSNASLQELLSGDLPQDLMKFSENLKTAAGTIERQNLSDPFPSSDQLLEELNESVTSHFDDLNYAPISEQIVAQKKRTLEAIQNLKARFADITKQGFAFGYTAESKKFKARFEVKALKSLSQDCAHDFASDFRTSPETWAPKETATQTLIAAQESVEQLNVKGSFFFQPKALNDFINRQLTERVLSQGEEALSQFQSHSVIDRFGKSRLSHWRKGVDSLLDLAKDKSVSKDTAASIEKRVIASGNAFLEQARASWDQKFDTIAESLRPDTGNTLDFLISWIQDANISQKTGELRDLRKASTASLAKLDSDEEIKLKIRGWSEETLSKLSQRWQEVHRQLDRFKSKDSSLQFLSVTQGASEFLGSPVPLLLPPSELPDDSLGDQIKAVENRLRTTLSEEIRKNFESAWQQKLKENKQLAKQIPFNRPNDPAPETPLDRGSLLSFLDGLEPLFELSQKMDEAAGGILKEVNPAPKVLQDLNSLVRLKNFVENKLVLESVEWIRPDQRLQMSFPNTKLKSSDTNEASPRSGFATQTKSTTVQGNWEWDDDDAISFELKVNSKAEVYKSEKTGSLALLHFLWDHVDRQEDEEPQDSKTLLLRHDLEAFSEYDFQYRLKFSVDVPNFKLLSKIDWGE